MLGEHQLRGIDSILSSERRALVEHRVPGLAGNYLQDLGTEANTIVISGSMHSDDARDDFLTAIRGLYNAGEPVTFVADINTATDVSQVVIEDLEVVEVAGSPDSFRYSMRLRKYIPPPKPASPGLPGAGLLDTDLLDQAADLMDTAFNAIDALTSIPEFSDPTKPLSTALDGLSAATGGLDSIVDEMVQLVGEPPPGPE